MEASEQARHPWQDPELTVDLRVRALIAELTMREKVAQLGSVWLQPSSAEAPNVAPHQHEFSSDRPWSEVVADGVGQITRHYGTAPIDPAAGARALRERQRQVMAGNRLGIPAQVHEECLTGAALWQATIYPSPLCWGATFDPELIRAMGAQIGATLRRLGVHQGLAPVLDVVRDPRWGRVEETIGEDPYLVGTIGSAYVAGVESAGVVATLKHFVGYSASRAARNLAPVSMGRRELADVMLPPFEMALRAGARSVMSSYTDIDGTAVAADPTLLTDRLRGRYDFAGTVVSDYFGVAFLERLHGVAATPVDAAALALRAGVDVELPASFCFGEDLVAAIEAGGVDPALVDRALERVLRQKCELGLLDACPEGPNDDPSLLDGPEERRLAGEIARRSIVLLSNDGTLPLSPGRRVAVVGPRANEATALLGCYSFPVHVGSRHPEVPTGVEIPTLLDSLVADESGYTVTFARGCDVDTDDVRGFDEAAHLAAEADVCVVALGDRAGLFGAGTSGEGCDAADLRLPGMQEQLLDALAATGTPVVLVLLAGRPYDLTAHADQLAAAVCAFFPGEEGARAITDVLAGRVDPSGRLPISFPGPAAPLPSSYLGAPLAQRSHVSNLDPTPLYPFGHGLSYAPPTWEGVSLSSGLEWSTAGQCSLAITLSNRSDRSVSEVVQIYLHDPVAEIARPVQQLVGSHRVDLPAGATAVVQAELEADLTSYVDRSLERRVDPGTVELRVGASSADIRAVLTLEMTGPVRRVGFDRVLHPSWTVTVPT